MTSRLLVLPFVLTALLSVQLRAAEPPVAPGAGTAKKGPDPSLADVPDLPGLPRVLLIGDSISMGYTSMVRDRLKGRANVHRPAENCSETANGLKHLDVWLGAGKWDVIHFNFGLHDLKYLDANGKYVPPEQGKQVANLAQYEKNLRELVQRLKATGAKLIFATTTQVPAGSQGRVQSDENRYNAVALRVMNEQGVAIDDLHALVAFQQDKIQLPKNVHFTEAGYGQMADLVAQRIALALPPRSGP